VPPNRSGCAGHCMANLVRHTYLDDPRDDARLRALLQVTRGDTGGGSGAVSGWWAALLPMDEMPVAISTSDIQFCRITKARRSTMAYQR
jgi:hypothetical protein